MKRLHVNLKVRDLEESIRFYSTLLGSEPTRTKPDYAKWMLEDPRVNFSIVASGEEHGIQHLGIQAETPEELAELRGRIASLQLAPPPAQAEQACGCGGGESKAEVFDEGETICCYHASDKTWVTDAQGVSWETFYTSGESATFHAPAPAKSSDCCEASCCA